MNIPVSLLSAILTVSLLASCSTSTIPTPEDMDRYYKKAEEMAADRIAILEGKRNRGEITDGEFETELAAVRGRILNHATELAWARHENMDAQRRALGIPTGGHPVQIQVPGAGGAESFYRRAGDTGGGSQGTTPYGGSVMGGPNRGDRPMLPPAKEPGGQPEPEPAPEPAPAPAPAPAAPAPST